MNDLALARVAHVIAVVFWIGGVGFVTLVVLPWVRRNHLPEERLRAFHALEARFAPQACGWVLIAGASGIWMIVRAQLWGRFTNLAGWWMYAMVVVWMIFTLLLFVVEPLVLHRRMEHSSRPEADFRKLELGHRALLVVSIVAAAGAVGGSHGLF
jgi:uncharacterized membrane protein